MPGDRGCGSRIYWPGSRFDGTGFGQRTGSRSPWCTLTCQESPPPRRTIPARPRHHEPPGQEDRRDDEQASGDYAYPRQCLVQTARPMLGVLRLFGRNAGIICRWGKAISGHRNGFERVDSPQSVRSTVKGDPTVSRSAGKRCPCLSSVSTADLCPRSFCTTLTLAPSLIAGEAQVCQPVSPRSTLDQQDTLRTGDEGASNMRRCRVSAAIQPLDQANATRTRIPGAAGSRMLDVGDHHADSHISCRLRNRRGICFFGCLRARTRPRRRRCESSR
jgi:hypothetical protein